MASSDAATSTATDGDFTHRAPVAGGQTHEVGYEAKKSRRSASSAKKAVKEGRHPSGARSYFSRIGSARKREPRVAGLSVLEST
ncbi:DUF3606 domain-containing protein [Bradyrhizobium sp. 930_D9_N1_4]|uniref:DUF3606 domain-containing protein n=1 Tax=Bradyrhizobium sp. 930_D9_N1_4 TaxID=3240374 RepID=UPI003F899947